MFHVGCDNISDFEYSPKIPVRREHLPSLRPKIAQNVRGEYYVRGARQACAAATAVATSLCCSATVAMGIHVILLTTGSEALIEKNVLFTGALRIRANAVTVKFKSAANEATQDHQMQKCR